MNNTVFFKHLKLDTKVYINSLIDYLIMSGQLFVDEHSYWIVYGSVAINGLTPTSDIDILLVQKSVGLSHPRRVQESYQGRPVTVYVIAENDLILDGIEQKFGGYFTGKLLSPFIVYGCDNKSLMRMYKSISIFMSKLSNEPLEAQAEPLHITREYIQRYLTVCPWYRSYLIKFIKTIGLNKAIGILSLHYVNIHRSVSTKQQKPLSKEELYKHTLRLVARFWSYGAIEHGNDYCFSDYYFDKAERTASSLDPEGVIWKKFISKVEE